MSENIEFNLYVKFVNNRVEKLIMPDSYGQLVATAPTGQNWYAVKWPVNPHFTGERMLAEMLNVGFPMREPV